ncbi:MAG: glycosyltransferase family 2 protein [Caulobacteraceae bacterium]
MKPAIMKRFSDMASTAKLAFVAAAADLSVAVDGLSDVANGRDALVAVAPGEAFVHPEFLALVLAAAADRPDVDVFYGDDVALGGSAPGTHLKPGWNPALLHAQDYIGAPIIVRGAALHRLGGLRPEAGTAALYDLVLRAAADGLGVDAVREILIAYPGDRPEPTTADRTAALDRALAGSLLSRLPGLTPRSSRVRRQFKSHPDVTLLIATRQALNASGAPYVTSFLESLEASAWPADKLHVLIADDVVDDAIYGDLARYPFDVTRLLTPREVGEPFNYAAKMNTLWRAAQTELVVMMNDDLEVISTDWLEALMSFAVDADIGGVGARLLYADGSIQHAGMVGGLYGVFAHAWIGRAAEQPTYEDWALVQRDWSVVTGAVFATRKSVLEAVNGFDERFALEYNDVDLCLRMKMLGYRIVLAPDALLTHHEKSSRGETAPPGSQTARFLRRWGDMIKDDPAYHPDLTRDSFVVQPKPTWGAWYSRIAPHELSPQPFAAGFGGANFPRDKSEGAS